jgi:hypothetical protein
VVVWRRHALPGADMARQRIRKFRAGTGIDRLSGAAAAIAAMASPGLTA